MNHNKISKIKSKNDFEYKTLGFSNIGNSCYMNSFLQILLHSPNFINELKKRCNYTCKNHLANNCLIKIIINLSNSEYPYNKKYLYEIFNCMKNVSDYESFIQNDSQDFGKDLINEIIENYKKDVFLTQKISPLLIKDKKAKFKTINNNNYKKHLIYNTFIENYQKKDIFIEKMFTVNEIETIYKNKANYDYIINTSFDIELTFPNQNIKNDYNLTDLFDFKYCLNNNDLENKKFLKIVERKICKLPDILIITIIRKLIGINFSSYKLFIPDKIDLDKYIDKDIIKDKKTQFDLYAINKKIGKSHLNGHYFCDIKIKEQWYEFDDEYVSEFKFNQNKPSTSVIGLFYFKIN